MCGRYVLYLSPSALCSRLAASGLALPPPAADVYRPRYNVAPGQTAAVITGGGDGLQLSAMKWGVTFPSSYSSSTSSTSAAAAVSPQHTKINTRADSLAATRYWSRLKPHRCVVPSNGFYEWLPATKQPHHVRPATTAGPPVFLFAGLYDPAARTYTVITTESAEKLRFLHERMPVVLEPAQVACWLDPAARWDVLQKMLVPWEGAVDVYPVSREVGKVGNDSSTFIEPVSERKDGIRAGLERQRLAAATSAARKRKADDDEAPSSSSPPPPVKTAKKETTEDTTVQPPPPPPSTPMKTQKIIKSATSNAANRKSPKKKSPKKIKKPVSDGNRKITGFFK